MKKTFYYCDICGKEKTEAELTTLLIQASRNPDSTRGAEKIRKDICPGCKDYFYSIINDLFLED